MPLLPLGRCLFPDDLFALESESRGEAADVDSLRWWVLHTRPRAEKCLAKKLFDRDVHYFLPQFEKQRLQRGRLQSSYLPLFPGYLFLHGDEDARLIALKTNLIVNCIPVRDQIQLASDLARVHSLMSSGAPLTPEERLAPGDLVQILEGCLAGHVGRITRCGKKLKFTVVVEAVQRGVSTEVDPWMIRPLAEIEKRVDGEVFGNQRLRGGVQRV